MWRHDAPMPERPPFDFSPPTPSDVAPKAVKDGREIEEDGLTFQPAVNQRSRNLLNRYSQDPERGKSPERSEAARRAEYASIFEKLYKDADVSKARRATLTQQREEEEEEKLRQIREEGRQTALSPRARAKQEENRGLEDPVFSRLYVDARRYHQDRAEREKLRELQKKMERREIPYDPDLLRAGGLVDVEDELESAGKPQINTPKRRRSSLTPRRAHLDPEIIERLSKPLNVTEKYEKLKEREDELKKLAERQAQEAKDAEMAQLAKYTWELPAPSFKLSDLQNQNTLFT